MAKTKKNIEMHCVGWRSLGFENGRKLKLIADFEVDIPDNLEETQYVTDRLEAFFDKSKDMLEAKE
jgi:hypothetical protein